MTIRRGRNLATGLLVVALSVGAAAPALAKGSDPSPSTSSDMRKVAKVFEQQVLREAVATWNASVRAYKAALAARGKAVQAINDAFAKAIQRAKYDFSYASTHSSGPADLTTASMRLRDAIDRATAARQAALDALPALPPAPGSKPTTKSLAKASPSASPTPIN